MKNPEFGDVIVTNNGKRWVCADSKTILEKVGVDPDVGYYKSAIKAYSVELEKNTFMVWDSVDSTEESWGYQIKEVIPAKTIHQQIQKTPRMHSELIKAWADGADVEWYDPGTKKWTPISGPTWREDAEYRIKTTTEFVCHINSDGEIISFDSGNLSLTFNNLGELISAEVIKK